MLSTVHTIEKLYPLLALMQQTTPVMVCIGVKGYAGNPRTKCTAAELPDHHTCTPAGTQSNFRLSSPKDFGRISKQYHSSCVLQLLLLVQSVGVSIKQSKAQLSMIEALLCRFECMFCHISSRSPSP